VADFNVGSIDATLGFDYESIGADRWEKKVQQAEVRAAKPIKQKLAFETDERGFNLFDRRTRQSSVNVGQLAGSIRGLVQQASLITAAGLGVEGIAALGGAAVAATSAVGPLVGVLGALPGAALAAKQGLGVFRLATANIFEAVGGINEKLVETSKQFRELDPAAQKVARRLDELKKPVRELQKEA
jgi:hypothetical protein